MNFGSPPHELHRGSPGKLSEPLGLVESVAMDAGGARPGWPSQQQLRRPALHWLLPPGRAPGQPLPAAAPDVFFRMVGSFSVWVSSHDVGCDVLIQGSQTDFPGPSPPSKAAKLKKHSQVLSQGRGENELGPHGRLHIWQASGPLRTVG